MPKFKSFGETKDCWNTFKTTKNPYYSMDFKYLKKKFHENKRLRTFAKLWFLKESNTLRYGFETVRKSIAYPLNFCSVRDPSLATSGGQTVPDRNLLPDILSCAPSGPTSSWVGVTLKAGRYGSTTDSAQGTINGLPIHQRVTKSWRL
jgi:hypothetical protein